MRPPPHTPSEWGRQMLTDDDECRLATFVDIWSTFGRHLVDIGRRQMSTDDDECRLATFVDIGRNLVDIGRHLSTFVVPICWGGGLYV